MSVTGDPKKGYIGKGRRGEVGGSGVSATLTAGVAGATSVPLTLAVQGGVLEDWDLEQSDDGGETWDSVANGITGATKTAPDLAAETAYQFRATVRVQSSATATVAATTAVLPPIALSQWAQVEGGQQFGGELQGGGVWFWNDPAKNGTFEAWIKNPESDSVTAIETLVDGAAESYAPLVGWGVMSSGVWDLDEAIYQPGTGGSVASPKIVPTASIELSNPVAANGYFLFQEEFASGVVVPASSLSTASFPATGLVNGEKFLMGSSLGTGIGDAGILGIGPMASRVYLRRSGSPHYNFAIFGDSTTVPVRPLSATDQLSREGANFRANETLRSSGKRVRIYSYGQGAAEWSGTLARIRANLPFLGGKISRIAVQVWTWNSPWNTTEQAEAAWAEYLAVEAEAIALGFGCSPLILHPYTTRNGDGQPEAFSVIKAHAQAHPYGIVLDEIMGGESWPNLPTEESEDNVHQNGVGAVRTGPLIAPLYLAVAALDYPELA